jgi:hypothetical protein
MARATQILCCLAGKYSHVFLQNSHIACYPVSAFGKFPPIQGRCRSYLVLDLEHWNPGEGKRNKEVSF